MNDTIEFVQSLEEEYGIALGFEDDDCTLDISQYYGDSWHCDMSGDDCSNDGCLWQADDMGSPYYCTHHAFDLDGTPTGFVVTNPDLAG